jgi:hypothetical protein
VSEPAIGIRSWGAVAPAPGTRLPEDLEPLTGPLVGRRFRKIGRFIKLAMGGAALAVKASGLDKLPADRTGVLFGTGIGNTPDLVGFCEATLGGPTEVIPSAVQFAHSVGNSGAFYVAQAFGLTGPVLATSQDDVSFECALGAARDLLVAGIVDLALVGGADVYFPDDAAQRQRMALPDSIPAALSEGSGWVLLERAAATSRARLGPVFVGDGDPVEALTAHVPEPAAPSVLALSARLSPLSKRLLSALPGARLQPSRGAFPTESAVALCAWLDDAGASAAYHSASATKEGFLGLFSASRAAGATP